MNAWMDGWMDGWTATERMGGWMNTWTNGRREQTACRPCSLTAKLTIVVFVDISGV